MKIEGAVLAKRYAQAFMNVFGHKLDLTMIECLDLLGEYLHQHRYALTYVQYAVLDAAHTQKNLFDLLEHCGVGEYFTTLITMLVNKKRIFLLSRIMYYIGTFYRQEHRMMHWVVESPLALSNEELIKVKLFLEAQTGKKAICTLKQNSSLIAGLRIYSSTLCFERSIRQQLRSLQQGHL